MASHVDSIEFLNTQDIVDVYQKFRDTLTSLNEIRDGIELQTTRLYAVWNGQGRNAFENQYRQLFSKISDINDALDEMYQAMVNAVAAYQQVDEQIAQQIDMASGVTEHKE